MGIESIGGYRIVRKLGEGERAQVLLGYPEREGSTAPPAAIKVFRPEVGQAAAIAEAEALARASGPHVVDLLDLTTAPDATPALVLGRLPGHSLARVLAERTSLRVGETITILAPVAATVARLHRAGVMHGAIRGEAVLFSESGAPVLACFGRASLMSPGQSRAALHANDGVRSELEAVRQLLRTVLGRTHDDAAASLSEWIERDWGAVEQPLDEVVDRLFALGTAEAVSMRPAVLAPPAVPNRSVGAVPAAEVATAPETATRAALGLPEWVARLVPGGDVVGRIRGALATVRPRLWIVSGAVAVALTTAVLLVPTGESDATPAPSASAVVPVAATSSAPHSESEAAVLGDDPAAAVIVLLELRDRCIRDASVLCLDGVDQQGSAGLADDQALVRELQAGAELPAAWSITEVAVEERMGGSALVSVIDPADSEPASVLLVKGEAGWRIRDYLRL